METMKNSIKVSELLPATSIEETAVGEIVDMAGKDTALVLMGVGAITGTPTSIVVTLQESDSATFATGVTTIKGGDATTVAEDTLYQFQVERTKRYLRPSIVVTGGTDPTALMHIHALLTNWARPFNIA